MESPEMWFEDFGTAQLVNGEIKVELDALFLETVVIDADHPMHVFLQEQGESNGLYVIPGTTGFTVREKNGGTSDISFSYRILAKRVNYQDHRFGMDPTQGFEDTRPKFQYVEPFPIDPQIAKQRVDEAHREKMEIGKKMEEERKEERK
jgi:hypothetical protein